MKVIPILVSHVDTPDNKMKEVAWQGDNWYRLFKKPGVRKFTTTDGMIVELDRG